MRTPQEVAELLRCSVSSLAKWRRAGTGPAFVRIGNRIRYRLIDIARYVDRNTTHVPPLPTQLKRFPASAP
jgi:predicted site-specific integrase-resolvase